MGSTYTQVVIGAELEPSDVFGEHDEMEMACEHSPPADARFCPTCGKPNNPKLVFPVKPPFNLLAEKWSEEDLEGFCAEFEDRRVGDTVLTILRWNDGDILIGQEVWTSSDLCSGDFGRQTTAFEKDHLVNAIETVQRQLVVLGIDRAPKLWVRGYYSG